MLQQTKMWQSSRHTYQGQQRAAALLLLPLPHRPSLPALRPTAMRGLQLLLEWKAAPRQLRFSTAHSVPLQGLHRRPQHWWGRLQLPAWALLQPLQVVAPCGLQARLGLWPHRRVTF